MVRTAAVKASKEPLSRERIETAALELIERDGLAAFSTRKLAAELNCEAMSIYHYFPSKGHLMDALVDRLVGGLTVLRPTADWRHTLESSAREWRTMARAYPAFFQFLSIHRLNTRVCLKWLDGILSLVMASGMSEEDAVRAFRWMGYYLTGAGLDEGSGYAKGHTAADPVPEDELVRAYPSVVKAGTYFRPEGFEKTFEAGLKVLLDGMERMVVSAQTTSGGT